MDSKYSHNSLFRPGDVSYLNACVGPNGGPYEFEEYAIGYFEAGSRLLNDFVIEKDDVVTAVPRGIDLLVYPIVFLYRHGIELSIKCLCRRFAQLWDDDEEIAMTHRLIDNWNRVKGYMNQDGTYDRELIAEIETILHDFMEIDPDGQRFRFPEGRDRQLHLQELAWVNLVVFAQAMGKVVSAFNFWFDRMEVQEMEKSDSIATAWKLGLFDE